MKNPILDREHLKDYLTYGSISAVAFIIPVIFILSYHKYENLYLLFLGSFLFMVVIFYHNLKLSRRPYDEQRSVSMLIAAHLTVITGIIISVILVIILFFIFFPHPFTTVPQAQVLKDVPRSFHEDEPIKLLGMLLVETIVGNIATGSFISIMTSYTAKLNQTKDKQASLGTDVQR